MPMIVMAVCYTLMGRELWGSRSIGELTQRQIDSIKSKRKVSRMSGVEHERGSTKLINAHPLFHTNHDFIKFSLYIKAFKFE